MSYSIADHLSGWGLNITMQLLCRERLAIELTVTLLTRGQPVIIITFCNYLFKMCLIVDISAATLTSLFPKAVTKLWLVGAAIHTHKFLVELGMLECVQSSPHSLL